MNTLIRSFVFLPKFIFSKNDGKNSITLAIWWNLRIGMWKSIYFSFNLIKHSYFQICINSIDIFVELKQQKIFFWPDEFYRNKNLIHFSSVLQHKSTLFQSLCKFWKRYIIQKREWFLSWNFGLNSFTTVLPDLAICSHLSYFLTRLSLAALNFGSFPNYFLYWTCFKPFWNWVLYQV